MPPADPCPDLDELRRFTLGEVSEQELAQLESHLSQCPSCLETMHTVHAEDTLVQGLRAQDKAVDVPPDEQVQAMIQRLESLCLPAADPSSDATVSAADADQPSAEMKKPGEEGAAAPPASESTAEIYGFLSPPQRADELGRLGSYRVLNVLGSGGMGVVFRAEDVHLHRFVALKVLAPALAAKPAARQRFLREARAAASVEHDHIVHINHVGEDRGMPFVTMPLLKGEPLEARLRREGRLPLSEVLRIGREIAEGLAAAHDRGLVHRDIKPANIWLESRRGGTGEEGVPSSPSPRAPPVSTHPSSPTAFPSPTRVKILDFGLARPADDDARLTRIGTVVGTPSYMAPEQARGEAVDRRCDLFSLGCVLYRMGTGAAPFAGVTAMHVLSALALHQPRPPRELNPDLPPALEQLVLFLLAKEPDQRPETAHQVIDAIQTIEEQQGLKLGGLGSRDKPVISRFRARRWRRLVAALAGVAGVLLAGVVVYVQTDRGTLRIEMAGEHVRVVVEQGSTEVRVIDTRTADEVRLPSGEYRLRLAEGPGDVQLTPDRVTLRRGRTEVATVTRVAKPRPEAAPPVAGDAWARWLAGLPAQRQVEEVAAELKRRNPGFDGKLTPTIESEAVTRLEFNTDRVTDLAPVRALPRLTDLVCKGSLPGQGKLADLSPLKGLRLTTLVCANNPGIKDLTPLKDLPLTSLSCQGTEVAELSPLRGTALTQLDVGDDPVSDLAPLRGMPLTTLYCQGTKVADLAPLKGMRLEFLSCTYTPVGDLAPLAGMPLKELYCGASRVRELSPLKGMALKRLNCCGSLVKDLAPLAGTPLSELDCGDTLIADLAPLKGMQLTTLNFYGTRVTDLSPLRGMPLTWLGCGANRITDLSPLAGMRLTYLGCNGTNITDLSPLKDMPLKGLWLDFKGQQDAAVLRSIKTLETINARPAAQFWREVEAGEIPQPAVEGTAPNAPLDEVWVKRVAALPAEKQVEEVAAELKRRNPAFVGQLTPVIDGAAVTGLEIRAEEVTDLTPVRALPGLRTLACLAYSGKGRLADLRPLRGLPLTAFQCSSCQVANLRPLQGMPLVSLNCYGTQVASLAPLRLMPLTVLRCGQTNVSNLAPLKGMPLTALDVSDTRVADLVPLAGMPLTELRCCETRVRDLTPLRGMRLGLLNCGDTAVADLAPLAGMPLTALYCYKTRVADLAPLKGMPLTRLSVSRTPVADLSPLRGMRLKVLACNDTNVTDLSPLAGMPLKELLCDFKAERDAAVLRSLKTLETINGKPAVQFWKDVDAGKSPQAGGEANPPKAPLDEAWANRVAALPAQQQLEEVAAELKRRNPGFDGKLTPVIAHGAVTSVEFRTEQVTDLTPVRAFPELRNLHCVADTDKGKLADLWPLKGLPLNSLQCSNCRVADLSALRRMPLTYVNCYGTQVASLAPLRRMRLNVLFCGRSNISDLAPLKGMPLTCLDVSSTGVADLAPLAGMPLTELRCFDTRVRDLAPLQGMRLDQLNCGDTGVADLGPLAGMPLTVLYCYKTRVADLAPLKDMPLTRLSVHQTPVADLSPLRGMHLRFLACSGTKVNDLSPLKGMPLKELVCDFKADRDAAVLRSIKTLETINGKPAVQFWKDVDAGKSPQPGGEANPPKAPLDEAWAKRVAALPAEKQVEEVAAELKRRNPGFDGRLTPTVENGAVIRLDFFTDHVTDLKPVRVLQRLTFLSCVGSQPGRGKLANVSPLKGLRLAQLSCGYNREIKDVTGLQDLPLTELYCQGTQVADLSPLGHMALTALSIDADPVSDLSPLRGMPLTSLSCENTRVADLAPLKGMPLKWLNCRATSVGDLAPVAGMPLKLLYCGDSRVKDLAPLKGMALNVLNCSGSRVKDLAPLARMPLSNLDCGNTLVVDLAPLKGMALTSLYLYNTGVTDLSPLRGMPLTRLVCGCNRVADLSPLKGMHLTVLYCDGTNVADLSPLKDMPLKEIWFDFKSQQDAAVLRSLKTLETINGKPAAQFWKEVGGERPRQP